MLSRLNRTRRVESWLGRSSPVSLLVIPYLLRIKDLQIVEFSCRETLNNEYDDLFAEDIS